MEARLFKTFVELVQANYECDFVMRGSENEDEMHERVFDAVRDALDLLASYPSPEVRDWARSLRAREGKKGPAPVLEG